MAEIEPRVGFLIGGVQKAGTTALARCLALHPDVALPRNKEAHVFDDPDFDERWGVQDIDRRYAPHFEGPPRGETPVCPTGGSGARWVGDATPIYMLHERFVARVARYNPRMRWIVLLRHPVERAISHHAMERRRGLDSWPLLPALVFERHRLAGHMDDFSVHSALRVHSYCLRGDYARQLDVLNAYFPSENLLVLRSDAFDASPGQVLAQVYDHLALSGTVRLPESTRAFEGNYRAPRPSGLTRRISRWLMRQPIRELGERYGIWFD